MHEITTIRIIGYLLFFLNFLFLPATMNATEQIKNELKKLTAQGVSLFNAMQAEQHPDRMKAHFEQVLKRDYTAFVNSLPSFNHAYQSWYSSAQAVIKKLLPGRLADFISLYEQPKGRKEIRQDNYVIEDYLKDITVTAGFDKKVVAGPADAIPVFQQQMNILNTVLERLDSSLFDMERLLQADLLDRELQMARQLAKDKFLRSAGAICGVILEKHFWQLCQVHQIKPAKKNMLIKDFNELFKKQEVYGFETARFVEYLGDLWTLCCKNKKEMPTGEEASELIDGTEKVIKTVF